VNCFWFLKIDRGKVFCRFEIIMRFNKPEYPFISLSYVHAVDYPVILTSYWESISVPTLVRTKLTRCFTPYFSVKKDYSLMATSFRGPWQCRSSSITRLCSWRSQI
jgi:hypothetical protein